ncbi:MAG: D-alanyl-D-alanine carboxypeptidase [Rhizobiales bacterium]|nr:D-alanyl-D-alanine carboxypeptidase [Hyphomicrobiales bacterium]
MLKRLVLAGLFAAAALALAAGDAPAQPFESKAEQAFAVETATGTVLLSKNPDTPVPPASMAKLMTVAVVFEALKSGRITLDTEYKVSENAWRTGGAPSGTSTMFAALKSSIRVEDLLKGVMVQGANDGCIILAEGLAGDEQKFVAMMNAQARALGLTRSHFVNSTGLPADGQGMTMRELVRLARHVAETYPEYYAYFALPDFTWNKITQRNRNPLLAMNIGADGVLTGFTEGSGYALLGSVRRGDGRIVAAIGGLKSDRERADEARRLFDWINGAFSARSLFAANAVVGSVPVYGGSVSHVAVRTHAPVGLFLPADKAGSPRASIVYSGPLVAPVEEGDAVGILRIQLDGAVIQETPLYAAQAVPEGPLHSRAMDALAELLTGWIHRL